MLRIVNFIFVRYDWLFIEKLLSISKLPVTKSHHHQRCKLQYTQPVLIQLIAQHGWFLVKVSELQPFTNIHVD